MKPFTEVAEICRGDAGELTLWVERRWVLPTISEGESLFNDADVARVEMIAELRRD
ncbi:MAG: hypothetical protein HY057_09290, partial [Rhodospirillales bacterium]|nr:hypothetical protein [Rhodospirillales bacterium]